MLLDQLFKHVVSQSDEFRILGVSIRRELNTVGVFGFNLSNELLIVLNTLVILILGSLLWRRRLTTTTRIAIWLLLGGALSNTLDRILQGGVVDIIALSGGSRFNLADVMIVLGALALIRSAWRQPATP